MPTSTTINGSRVIGGRLFIPWRGAWFADLQVDPDIAATFLVAGPAIIQIGTSATLRGTFDATASGRFGEGFSVRVVGGGGGWDKKVAPQHFLNGVTSAVYVATGLLVGEVAVDPLPLPFQHFARSAGPASAVFGDKDWYVDLLGVTQVSVRLPAIAPIGLEVTEFDPETMMARAVCDGVVLPGTILVDLQGLPPRWTGPLTVRDVEHVFSSSGTHVNLWCSQAAAVSRLTSALTNYVREVSGRQGLREYRYTVVSQAGTQLSLQAVNSAVGVPDMVLVDVWVGNGLGSMATPGQQVRVGFLEGDPKRPVVTGFDPTLPLQASLDASVSVKIGPTSPLVALAGGTTPVTPSTWSAALQAALTAFAAACAPSIDPTLVSAAAALATALSSLPPGATTKVVAA